MQNGYLSAQIFTGRETLPIEGADVYITQEKGGQSTLIKQYRSDKSGNIPVTEISAPDMEYSEHPGAALPPFAVVDMRISLTGFFTILIKNIQVFAQQVTFQQVEMIPLPQSFTGNTVLEYDVLPQNL